MGADPQRQLVQAVEAGGGIVTPPEDAGGLVWGGGPGAELGRVLARSRGVRWVQLPSAGVEDYAPLPLTRRTRNLVGERELRLLAAGAVVVNVGRGGVLDQTALLARLEEAALSGAALDVTAVEPLPPENPLWAHPRCLITSHTSNPPAWRQQQFAALVEDNVSLFLAGRDLRGKVDLDAGY